MKVTLVDCDTCDSLSMPGNPFPAFHTYTRGGTMLDSGASPLPPSAEHGGHA